MEFVPSSWIRIFLCLTLSDSDLIVGISQAFFSIAVAELLLPKR
ncbi:hypothetical protein EV13_2234 [Prochlorococcus sp. MIT 0702]|nr:hypothetical protein EV13_2234 [Prochlorococcus sp. MIT 0702]